MPDQSLYAFLKEKGLSSDSSDDTPDSASPSPSSEAPAERVSADRNSGPQPLLQFDDPNVGENLHKASKRQLDAADFGIVGVDDEGVVEFYNQYEAELAGVTPEEAMGRNFFTQLAPCSNNRIFLGRFKSGVRSNQLDESFTYTFTYKMRPTLVDIRLYRDSTGSNWVLVRKR